MKHAQRILKANKDTVQSPVLSTPSFESLGLPDYGKYLERHISLEAAATVLESDSAPGARMMAALLVDSMGYGESVALESMESSPVVALEAAKEANVDKARQAASKFNDGLIGWVKKTFSARGKFFSELDKVIAEVKAKDGKFTLTEEDQNKYGEKLYSSEGLDKGLNSISVAFDALSKASFRRMASSLSALKSGNDPVRAYDGILQNYTVDLSKVLPTVIDQRPTNVLGSTRYVRLNRNARVGEYTFVGSVVDLDITGITKDNKVIDDIRGIAHFYEKLSKESYVYFDEVMQPKAGNLPTDFKSLLSALMELRDLMDNVIDVDRLKTLSKFADEESDYIQKNKIGEPNLFASWIMTSSNFASSAILYKSAEENVAKVAHEIISFARTALTR